ncbi:MAG: hypothetical protein GY856_48145 [bacterium]|nr:hypothetical protein [bacterium]
MLTDSGLFRGRTPEQTPTGSGFPALAGLGRMFARASHPELREEALEAGADYEFQAAIDFPRQAAPADLRSELDGAVQILLGVARRDPDPEQRRRVTRALGEIQSAAARDRGGIPGRLRRVDRLAVIVGVWAVDGRVSSGYTPAYHSFQKPKEELMKPLNIVILSATFTTVLLLSVLLPQTSASAAASYPLVCRGGGNMYFNYTP